MNEIIFESDKKCLKIRMQTIILLIYFAISSIVLYILDWNVNAYVLCSIILIFLCIAVTKLDILNPLVWYVSIFIIYQISYPWLKTMGIDTSIVEPLNDKYVVLNWIATCCTTLFLSNLKSIKYNRDKVEMKINKVLLVICYILVILISTLGLLYTVINGYTSKYDIAQSSDIIIKVSSIFINSVNIVTLYVCLNKNYNKKTKIIAFIISFIIMFLGMGILGERDLIIKYVAIFLLYYVALYSPKKTKIMALIASIIVLISISSSLKMFFVRDNGETEKNNLIVKFLSSDFQAGGLNFNYILNREGQWELKNGSTLIYDFLSPFTDFIKFPEDQISTQWYQNTFFSNSITGRGFSIIAEGYINFSTYGIVLWMFIICIFIRILYLNSNKSIYTFAVYICACPMLMYIARADLANFISPFVKYILLFTIIMYFISERKKKNDTKKQLSE